MSRTRIAAVMAFAIHAAPLPVAALEPDPPQKLISVEEGVGIAVRDRLEAPQKGLTEGDKSDREALAQFYVSRANQPLWVDGDGLTAKAKAVIDEIRRADDWGLEAAAFDVPATVVAGGDRDSLVAAEMKVSVAALKYARFARGGRIPEPRKMSSYLDRDPPLLSPIKVLESLRARRIEVGGVPVLPAPVHAQLHDVPDVFGRHVAVCYWIGRIPTAQ